MGRKRKEEEKYRDRKFRFLLYPDDLTHVKALDIISQSYDYAYILHDKDLDETGELKKPHWHVVVNVGNNGRWNTSLTSELGIEPNYIMPCDNVEKALQYLIHYNDFDKYHYDVNEVKGTMKNKLEKSLNVDGKDEGERIMEIIEMLEESDKCLSITDFVKMCAKKGYYTDMRRGGIFMLKLLEEHNERHRVKSVRADFKDCFNRRTGELYETPFYDYDKGKIVDVPKETYVQEELAGL